MVLDEELAEARALLAASDARADGRSGRSRRPPRRGAARPPRRAMPSSRWAKAQASAERVPERQKASSLPSPHSRIACCIASTSAGPMPRRIGTMPIVDPRRLGRRSRCPPTSGWPGSSPSGRLLTIIVTPCSGSSATCSGRDLAADQGVVVKLPDHRLSPHAPATAASIAVTIAPKLGFAHALNPRQLGERLRPRRGDLAQGRIVEDDVRRDPGFGGDLAARRAQALEQRVRRPVRLAVAAPPPLAAAGWRWSAPARP